MFRTHKQKIEDLKSELRTEKFKREQLEKEIKELKEKQKEELTNVMLKAGKAVEKSESFILKLKQRAFGKGTIVEILDDTRKMLMDFKID